VKAYVPVSFRSMFRWRFRCFANPSPKMPNFPKVQANLEAWAKYMKTKPVDSIETGYEVERGPESNRCIKVLQTSSLCQ